MKALIIDGSRTMRRILASYLSELTTDIFEAGDGVQALEQLQLHAPIDLALVDWDMPKMNGLEFVKAVRADPAFAETKLLMVIPPRSLKNADAVLVAGCNDFLMKPVTGEMVIERIRQLGLVHSPSPSRCT